ncbi:FGFR1 oncogene partner isoform X5 [Acanthopagrus latus]|uniref:FGFR1 oncogene partner isoform X5 n=1 Tax=Acanthopagrus latus TaxID=8177 RepID=UPI00187CDC3E|nr:FGFR1 oncogene partner isoform X5 [Acanthopagrus latus]
MSATDDDTELRDLLIQNLENNGVLNKLKAEMRAAVFLAMEEQDKLENKTPLINENLKKCLNTKDGRLAASLMVDFLQVFNLDFTLAVFQPEINWLSGLDSRDLVCRDLGLSESELNRNSPLLLELIRRGPHKPNQEPSHTQITHARKKFDVYDKNGSGSILREDLKRVFTDLFPSLNKNMLETFISDELRAADKSFSKTIDFQLFLGFYQRLFCACRSVVVQDSDVTPPLRISCPPVSKIPRYKGQSDRGQSQTAAQDSEGVASLGPGDLQQQVSRRSELSENRRAHLDLDLEDDPDEGDSFFDDPLPKPQKTYGWKVEVSRPRESPAGSLSDPQKPGGGGGSSASEQSHSRNGASNSRERGSRDPKILNDKTGSLHLDDDIEYDDDFNSHRSDLSKSELSIGEEIEEVSIEGPEHSDKFDETTQDLSVSQLSLSHGADYMEDVA